MIYPYVLLSEAFLLFVYRVAGARKTHEVTFLLAALFAGAVLAVYESASLSLVLLGIVIFNGLASSYHSKKNYLYFLLAVLYLLPTYQLIAIVSQSMLLGFLSAAYFFAQHTPRLNVKLERKRDVAQVVMGLIVILAFALFAEVYVKIAIIFMILLLSLVGNYATDNRKRLFSKVLHSFERSGAFMGQGGIWLAIGTLVAFSFLSGGRLIAVLAPIFIGDAVATLTGTTFKMALPYNGKKSAYGTLGYLLSAAFVSFPFVGNIAILTALVGAVVESLPRHIDDNFDTAVVLTVLVKLLSYSGFI